MEISDLRRPVYLHFLDRELLTEFGFYGAWPIRSFLQDVRNVLMCCYEPLYLSTSLIFESDPAAALFEKAPDLFQIGHVELLQREVGIPGIIDVKKEQYSPIDQRERYFRYFDDTWKRVADAGPHITGRHHDTSQELELWLLKNYRRQGLDSTARKLRARPSNGDMEKLLPRITDALLNRRGLAVTKYLFERSYDWFGASKTTRTIFDTKVSEGYVKLQMSARNGTIPTGLGCGLNYFDDFCPTFPTHHLPLWSEVYRHLGAKRFLSLVAPKDIVIIRETPSYGRMIDAIRQYVLASISGSEGHTSEVLTTATRALRENLPDVVPRPKREVTRLSEFIGLCDSIAHSFDVRGITPMSSPKKLPIRRDPKSVFVIYGRNENARKAMFEFLRSVNLHPLEWEQAVKLTGLASPYVGDVIDAGIEHSSAALVMFTGDDIARLRPELAMSGSGDSGDAFQPRPNVILEAGLALGKK